MNIRIANENDVENLIELMQEADGRSEEWATKRANKYTHKPDRLIFVAEEDSKLVGFSGMTKFEIDLDVSKYVNVESFSILTWIAVHPELRLSGIGSKLLSRCYDQATSIWEKQGIWLTCREKVLPFYFKNRFNIAGSYMYEGSLRYVMQK